MSRNQTIKLKLHVFNGKNKSHVKKIIFMLDSFRFIYHLNNKIMKRSKQIRLLLQNHFLRFQIMN